MNDKTRYNRDIHHRHSIRLKGYDYSQASAYFVTICTHHHECLFGDIIVGTNHVGAGPGTAPTEPAPTLDTIPAAPALTVDIGPHMELNAYGEIVHYTWKDLVNHVGGIELGEFVIMPNHIHGIIVILDRVETDHVGAGPGPAPTRYITSTVTPTTTTPAMKQHALPEIIRQFKTYSARRINEQRGMRGAPVWQRNYWEHIIRDELYFHEIATYIRNNPVNWEIDKLHP